MGSSASVVAAPGLEMTAPREGLTTASPPRTIPPALSLLLLLTGCSRYEYDIVQPPELAGHIGAKSWISIRRADVEYRLRTYDNRLVTHIYNRGGDVLRLLGADSAAVDPRGESHPLPGAAIPPGSYVKRIFPPPRPRVERYGPTIGVGVGYGAGYGHYRHRDPFYSPAFDDFGPRYYSVYDPNDRTFFQWPGATSIRLLLSFEREGGEKFRHEFLIRRRRIE
jgi:hypothetical protein